MSSCGAENEGDAPKCSRCGEDLTGASGAADSANTSVFAACSSCGERLDTGSLYCKGCGSAVYTDQTQRDAQSGLTTVQQKVPTLPDLDLDEQMMGQVRSGKPQESAKPESGANTLVFTGPGQALPRGPAETNTLTGTAGAKSEQQAPTQVMQMGRITGPVESDDAPGGSETGPASSPAPSAAPSAQLPSRKEQGGVAGETTLEFAAVSQPQEVADPDTLGLGSDSEPDSAPSGSENKTAVFVSRPQEAAPPAREQTSSDDIGTRPFTPAIPSPGLEPTREIREPTERRSRPLWRRPR